MFKLVTLLLLASSAYATPFYSCAGITPPTSVVVEGCDEFPCLLYRGEDVLGAVVFNTVATNTLTAYVKATTNGVTVDFPLPEPNACLSLTGGECPLTDGESIQYNIDMPVLTLYPKVDLVIKYTIVGDNEVPITCFSVDAKVVDRP